MKRSWCSSWPARREKNRIMKAIMDGAGPKAGAIVFSLPVTDTAGLRLLEDEEPVQETSAQ